MNSELFVVMMWHPWQLLFFFYPLAAIIMIIIIVSFIQLEVEAAAEEQFLLHKF